MKNRYFLLIVLVCFAGLIAAVINLNNKTNHNQTSYSGINIPAELFQKHQQNTMEEQQPLPFNPTTLEQNNQQKEEGYFPLGDSAFDIMSIPDPQLRALLSGNMNPVENKKTENKENTFAKPEPVSKPIALYTGEERTFGYLPQKPVHNPADEFFYLEVKEALSSQTEVYLEYDLFGVEDNTQVSRSINEQPVFGGYVVKQHNGWSRQSELINPDLLKQGINTIRFSIGENAKYSYKVKNLKLRIGEQGKTPDKEPSKAIVVKSKKNNEIRLEGEELQETETDRRLIVNQPTTAYYYRRFGYVQGFVTGEDYDKATIRIGGEKVRVFKGEFESLISRNSQGQEEEAEDDVLPSHAPWSTTVEAVFPDGEVLSVDILFEKPAQWDYLSGFDATIHHTEKAITQSEAFSLTLGSAALHGEAGSLQKNTNVSITALRKIDLPKLNPGMVNVTAGYDGYRFLPHGSNFDKPLSITIGYDSTKLPRGHYPQEIRTYYYDESRSHWVALPRDSVNKGDYLVCSRTTHFTDMINAIVKAPEMPETQEYTPTSLKELQAADPSSGIQMMQPPTANSQGTATLSYPINIPAGRQGMQPNLAVSYSSEAANGLLGMGWDMQIPAITVDNKWGVPRYYTEHETETYLYNGEELLPSARIDGFIPREADRQFYPRVESGFERIIRKGDNPKEYFWIVTDKQGTQHYYGTYDGIRCDTSVLLKDGRGNIAHWPLCKVVDINGNYMQYCYTKRYQRSEYQRDYPVTSPDSTGAVVYLGQQLWLDAINYTGNGAESGAYKVVFSSKNCSVDAARSIGCTVVEDTIPSLNSSLRGTVIDSLPRRNESPAVLRSSSSIWDDVGWEDVPGSKLEEYPYEPEEPENPGEADTCTVPNIRVQVCVVTSCLDIDLRGATVYLGTDRPRFRDKEPTSSNNSPYPVTFSLNDNPDYTRAVSTADGCVELMVCPNRTYHLVVIPPSPCSKDPVSVSFRVNNHGNVTRYNENGIPMIGAHTGATGNTSNGVLLTVPVECDCPTLPGGQVYCYDCWDPCAPYCPSVCRRKVYIGVQDNFCVKDKLPLCRFDLVCESDPYQTVYTYTTGYTKIQPLYIRCNEWYRVTGTYFGNSYQDTPIRFIFMIDNQGNVQFRGNPGSIHFPVRPRVIENRYNNGDIELLMPVVPKPKQTRVQIVDNNGQGVAGYTFLLGNASNGNVIERVYTTDAQGYTPMLNLALDNRYYLGEVDPTAYSYNLVGQGTYSDFVANWNPKVELYLMQRPCVLRIKRESHFPVPTMSCSSGVCTFVYQEPQRPVSRDIRIRKTAPDGEQIAGAVFRLNNTSDYPTGSDGLTPPITITSGQVHSLQETSVPAGFLLDDRPIYVSINNTGVIEVNSQMNFDYDPVSGILSVTNQWGCAGSAFMVRKQDAATGNALEGALIQYFKNNDHNNELGTSKTDASGRTHVMQMACGETYYIKEAAVPSGYNSEYPAFAVVQLDEDGSINILDSAQLRSWTKEGEVWVFTFVNHKRNDPSNPKPIEPVEGCSSTYAYDNTINTRNGFRQSSKEKLSKIVVFYKDSCVRTYTFCYTQDFYGRALLEAISQWGSEDTLEAYTHTFDYYKDAENSRQIFQPKETIVVTDNEADMDQNKRIDKKLRNFFMRGFVSPSILGGSRTWSTGINTGADIGLFPAFPLKTLSGGLYANASISSSKGKTTTMDINGDGLPDRVYNVMEGTRNKTYYLLQKPGRQGFETQRKELDDVKIFLEDFSDNASIGLQASAVIHGGIQKGFLGKSWTSVYFADLNGDGFMDLVSPSVVQNIGVHQKPPSFTFPDCEPPIIETTVDSVRVRCDTNFSFTTEIYERDRTQELRYDLVRVWQADMDRVRLPDLTYGICAPLHLAYDSIALENFCGEPDAVIASIEYYGTGLTGTPQHILLWSDVIEDSDMTDHGPDFCNLKIIPEPEPEPCPIVLYKVDHKGNPLANVVFKLEDGRELTTGADGFTPVFYLREPGSCIEVTEMTTLPHCYPFQRPFTLCKEEGIGEEKKDCHITLQGPGSIMKKEIGGRVVHIVTIVNDCNEKRQCFARIKKVDQYNNPLKGVEFHVDNQIGNGLPLTTDSLGYTSLLNIFAGGCSRIYEITPLSNCDKMKAPVTICADDKCKLSVDEASLNSPYPVGYYSEEINGMLIHTIVITNRCKEELPPCPVILRKTDQHGNPLGNVVFRLKDGRELITHADKDGRTPAFSMQDIKCMGISEIATLPHCTALEKSFVICREIMENGDCIIKLDGQGSIEEEWINGTRVYVITITNDCIEKPVCFARIKKVDQDNNPLEGVEFHVNNGIGNGLSLTTDGQGYTSLINIFDGSCSYIDEIKPLPRCQGLPKPIPICTDNRCNVYLSTNSGPAMPTVPFDYTYTIRRELINGMEINTIILVNQCDIKSGAPTVHSSQSGDNRQAMAVRSSVGNEYVNPDFDLSALRLDKGDKLFFRVRPQYNGVKKKVVWDPAVIPFSHSLSRVEYLDENGRIFGGGNKASQSQLLQGDSLFPCPAKGNITIESVINPLPAPMSDDVRFEIWMDNSLLYHYTLTAGQNTGVRTYTGSFNVDTNNKLKFKVVSKSNVNMHAIEWYPKVYYNYLFDESNTRIDAVISDDNNNMVRMLEYEIAPYHDFYHNIVLLNSSRLHKIYNTPATGNSVNRTLSSISITAPGINGKAYITVKQAGTLLFAREVSFGTTTLSAAAASITVVDDPAKPVYVSCYVADPFLAAQVSDCYVTIDNNKYRGIVYTKHKRGVLFGEFYGGWGQFLYQTDSIPNKDPMALMDMNKIKWLSTLTSSNAARLVDTSRMGGDSIRDLRSFADDTIAYNRRLAAVKDALFCLPMFNDPANRGHVGYYPNAFIRGADMNIGGIPCPEFFEEENKPCDELTEGQSSGYTGGQSNMSPLLRGGTTNQSVTGDSLDCFVPRNDGMSPSGGLGVQQSGVQRFGSRSGSLQGRNILAGMDPKKTSSSDNTSYSAGLSIPGIGLGLNESTTTTTQENDLMDLNGDGFPDIIRNDKKGRAVYYSFPKTATWEDEPYDPFGGPHLKTVTNTYGSSFTADPMGFISMAKNSNKGPTVPTKSKEGGSGGAPSVTGSKSATRSEDETLYTLMDINGDGLPDRVYNTGANVALNLGYSFEGAERWKLGEIGKNIGNAYSSSLGIGGGKEFSGGSESYSGGISGSTSYSESKQMLVDINGDGLPDKVVIAGNRELHIYYHTGCGYNGYGETLTLDSDDPALYHWSTTKNKGGNFGITLGFPIVWFAKVSMSGGADASFSLSSSNIQFMDMDADGYADLVIAPNDSTLIIRYSNLGRTGLLKSVTNPMGGSMELSYHKTEANVFHSRGDGYVDCKG